KDLPPTKYGENAKIQNSYIADGCKIYGTVINSVLSGDVTVGEDAVIKNSVLMQGVTVEKGTQLEYVVLDKDVKVSENKTLIGQESYPLPVAKGTVI
ncbi:MAG: glucose-1-phosphate adenylyltransferase subunit GlgD, partial [Clostridia bacterium]|nr:glucose-1-phosphate adenylyltransferase subunit GlgD [Clostridia bacterium]